MSALGLDDRRSAGGVRSYAPHREHATDDETSIRPVLERLKRGEAHGFRPRQANETVVQHAPPDDIGPVAKSPRWMTVRFVVAAGVVAGMAVLGAEFLVQHDGSDAAAPGAAVGPAAPVKTADIGRPLESGKGDKIADGSSVAKDAGRLPQNQLVAADATAPGPALKAAEPSPGDSGASPLKLWALMPADLPMAQPPADPPSVVQASADQTSVGRASAAQAPPAASEPAAADPAPKAADAHPARHVAHHRRSHHHRRRATVARAPAQSGQPADTAAAQAQSGKKLPLQAAIDRLFGNSAAGGAQPQPQPQPQPQ